jgi:hypothetical protein
VLFEHRFHGRRVHADRMPNRPRPGASATSARFERRLESIAPGLPRGVGWTDTA